MTPSNIMPAAKLNFINSISADLVNLLLTVDASERSKDIADTLAALFESTGNDISTLDRVNMDLSWIMHNKNG